MLLYMQTDWAQQGRGSDYGQGGILSHHNNHSLRPTAATRLYKLIWDR